MAGSGFFSDEEVDICNGYNHPAVVVQPFFISTVIDYLILKKLMFLEILCSQTKVKLLSDHKIQNILK